MIPVGKLLLAALASLTTLGLWKFFQLVVKPLFTSSLRHLPGPKPKSWLSGNLREVYSYESYLHHLEWVKQHGNTLSYRSLFCVNRLLTVDTRAINHILTHNCDYHKPSQLTYTISGLVGKGLIVAEGIRHRQQRRVMNPAFGPAQIRPLTSIYFAKAAQLRDMWSSEIAKDPARTITGARIDAVGWLNKTTLDIIGLAGFNYDFDFLNINEKPNELYEIFANRITSDQSSVFAVMQAWLPLLRRIPTRHERIMKDTQRTMAHIGKDLVSAAKAAARANATEKGDVTKDSLQGRDVLSLLVKANMAIDIPEDQRLSDEEVMAQIPTFVVAGHATTSMASSWALFELSKASQLQAKLRAELLSVDTETPSMDELNALPYLDAVVREVLRMYPSVPLTLRIAMKDDVIPLEKPFTDKNGVVHDSINITKGEPIIIPIQAINYSEELWGPDAHEFKPERWQDLPETVSRIPGVWAHILTFLGGPRACIGYRFALVEMKAILFTLLRAFVIDLAEPASEVATKVMVIMRPVLRSDPNTIQLPLLIKPYKRS